MSKLNQYINVHRRSRNKFMSIDDFNREYDADLPSNKAAEAAFHAALRRQRRMTGIPVRGSIYPLARELGIEQETAEPKRMSGKFSMRSRRSKKAKSRRMNCGCNAMDDCTHAVSTKSVRRPAAVAAPKVEPEEVEAIPKIKNAPVKRMGMRLSKINISRPSRSINRTNIRPPVPEKPKALNAIDERRKHTAAWPNHHNKQREGSKHPKGRGHMRHSHGSRRKAVPEPEESSLATSMELDAVEDHGTFSVNDARKFYQEVQPEFLEQHDLNDVVSAWNKASLQLLLPQIRAKYGQAPRDLWSLKDVQAFYKHYDPEFLRNNEIHSVMNDWAECEPKLIENSLRGKYGSVPGEPFVAVNWTPAIVVDYYNEVYPAKLQEMSPDEIIMDWNRHSVERVMEACKARYGKAPIPQNFESKPVPVAAASKESHIDLYKRALEDSGEHFDATKVLHFVPTNVEFGDFTSHASKMKSSTIRFLIDGVKGPFKMFNGEYKTFKSFNKQDMITAVNAIKSKKSGDFFIRVEE